MSFHFTVEELKNRLTPPKEKEVLVVLTFDLVNGHETDFLEITNLIVRELGFSSDGLPASTFVKIVVANRTDSQMLVEYYRMRVRNHLNNKGLKGSVFLVCGERWASSISPLT